MRYLCFWHWLISLSIRGLHGSPRLHRVMGCPSFCKDNTPLCVETNFHPFICWLTFTLPSPSNTVKNLAYMNMGVQIFCGPLFSLLLKTDCLKNKQTNTQALHSPVSRQWSSTVEWSYLPPRCSSCHQSPLSQDCSLGLSNVLQAALLLSEFRRSKFEFISLSRRQGSY